VLLLSGSWLSTGHQRDVLAQIVRPSSPAGEVMIDVFDPADGRAPAAPHLEPVWRLRPAAHLWAGDLHLCQQFLFLDADGVLNTSAAERIRVYSLPEWRALLPAQA
jgi:hypothetical protein